MNKKLRDLNYKSQMFLQSALAKEGIISLDEFYAWFESRKNANRYEVVKIPLTELKSWHFEPETGNLVHDTGKFFRIEGVDVRTNFGHTPHWMQPIINQPEIGILGFLTKKINGILHFLVQAKMEPGNINGVQLSPTVQATRSNFTQVHGGIRPPYLEYFIDSSRSRILVDQLQSEQGSRFFRKRNRNVIVEVREDEKVPIKEDFCWLTLGQLFELLKVENLVNMDSRTVLSCIQFASDKNDIDFLDVNYDNPDFHESVLLSAFADDDEAVNDFDEIISWLTYMKIRYELSIRLIPLNQVENWSIEEGEIRHKERKFFSVIGVSVFASNREVQSWHQPLISSVKGGILCFICQKKNGILHFIVQGRVEPGNLDCLEMAPTLQCTPANYDLSKPELLPPFYDFVMNARPDQIRYNVKHSEEGGRFYHDENQYLIIEADEDQELNLPDNYIWMTIRQMKEFVRFNNYLNIEARGLLSCLGLSK